MSTLFIFVEALCDAQLMRNIANYHKGASQFYFLTNRNIELANSRKYVTWSNIIKHLFSAMLPNQVVALFIFFTEIQSLLKNSILIFMTE